MFYLCQECTRVAKERITQSLQQVQTTIERSKVEEMFRESSQQRKALEVCEDVNAYEFIMPFPAFLYYFLLDTLFIEQTSQRSFLHWWVGITNHLGL